jgi:hypothetical protein
MHDKFCGTPDRGAPWGKHTAISFQAVPLCLQQRNTATSSERLGADLGLRSLSALRGLGTD